MNKNKLQNAASPPDSFAFSNEAINDDQSLSPIHPESRLSINKPVSKPVPIKLRKNQIGIEDNVSSKSEVQI